MCLVKTFWLNESFVSKLKDAALEMRITPICWNKMFYFVYLGPWISGADWLKSNQNINTLCLLSLPELDEFGWFIFKCPDMYC